MDAKHDTREMIEVTPSMVKAGLRALANYDPLNWSDDEVAAIIVETYRAMELSRHRSRIIS